MDAEKSEKAGRQHDDETRLLCKGSKDLDPLRSFLSLGPAQLDERRGSMVISSSFRMSVHRWDDNLMVNVMGDFDESSAKELIDALEHYAEGVRVAFIRTGGLKRIRKRAKEAFHNYMLYRRHGSCHRLVFPDANASRIVPASIESY